MKAARLPALGLLILILPSACGGRVGSQTAGQTGQAGRGGADGAGGAGSAGGANDPPYCCDPPIVTCFGAGTLIDTPAGRRPIEQIEVGEQVLGYDEELQAVVARPVTARMQHAEGVVGQLVLGDGRAIVTTPEHPFYDAGAGRYLPAGELRADAELLALSSNGRLSSATATGYFVAGPPVRMPVFNISVAGVHNYFAEGVLVHNKLPIDPCADLPPDAGDLVALTSVEHARSILELTGAQLEPLTDESTRNYYGQTLP
ncbi:MAG TPA: Hint domain-containing protein, partial [Polyangiaceae bacterium]